jgi:hypothetical protein
MNDKIANSKTALKPIILQAILDLFKEGKQVMTLKLVRQRCILLDSKFPKNSHQAAIATSMRNAIKCGGRIVGENRDFNDFTIAFDNNASHSEINNPEKSFQKEDTKRKITSEMSLEHIKNELKDLNISKKIKVVLVCANDKNDSYFTNYQNVKFFDISNHQANEFRPDDNIALQNKTWRTYLIEQQLDVNLKRAYQLYSRNEYNCLYNKFKNDFYILSAGWGLVNSEFRLPKYDITFSNGENVPIKTRRNRNIAAAPVYKDFNQLEVNDKEDIFFIGGKEYLKLFYKLTQGLENRKIIFYYGLDNCPTPIVNQNTFIFINFPSTDNRRWHYEVARFFCNSILP